MSSTSIAAAHTAGPWRWEFNRKHKSMTLVGGKPMYDLTIMDFDRWGMNGAVATLRDTAHGGFNIMHRLCDRPDWIAPFEGRTHHADWCADVIHPDMRLMAAAPDLLAALESMVKRIEHYSAGLNNERPSIEQWEYTEGSADMAKCRAAIAKATGAQP